MNAKHELDGQMRKITMIFGEISGRFLYEAMGC